MFHLRDDLLSPLTKGVFELSMREKVAKDEQNTRECAARGELEEMRGVAFYNRTGIVSDRYCSVGDGVDALEVHLHSLWHIYYTLGQHTSYEDREHDRLVLDILRIQGLGPLTRPVRGVHGIDIARTAEGVLWNDLSFLATDMTAFWMKNCASMSGAQRLNFTSFLAKLASTRVSKDRVCQIALPLFRETFETLRELRAAKEPDEEDTHRTLQGLEIAHFLPLACVWIKEAGHNLLQLSEVSWNDCPSEVGRSGPMLIESELGKRSTGGFSPWRWMYWLKRLGEIREKAAKANETDLEVHAANAIDIMVKEAGERNSEVLRVYQKEGDVLHTDKHLLRLKNLIGGVWKDDDDSSQVSSYLANPSGIVVLD